MRKKRVYIRLLGKAVEAMEEAIAAFNGVKRPYKVELSLMLMTNAWELLAKSVLVKKSRALLRTVTETQYQRKCLSTG